jgi:hypothetical protein
VSVILLPGVAAADSFSFSYKTIIISGFSPGYEYNVNVYTGGGLGSNFYFKITNAQYLPTYLYVSSSDSNSYPGLHVQYYPKTCPEGCCNFLATASVNVGMSGNILIQEDNKVIGTWSYVKRNNDMYFSASYDIDSIRKGLVNPIGKTIRYTPTAFWQSNEPDCGSPSAYYNFLDLIVNNPPSSSSPAYYLSSLQTNDGHPVIFTAPMITYGNVNLTATGSFISIKNVNISITHDPYSNIFIVNIQNGFDGKLNISLPSGQTYSYPFVANQFVQYFIPHYSNFMELVDINNVRIVGFELDKELESCLNPNLVGLKKLELIDQAGNRITQFSVVINDIEYSSSNGYVHTPDLRNQQVTVIPLNRYDLQFNTTVSTVTDITQITAPLYVYTVQIVVRQQDIMGGLSPVSFRYNITGEEYANKTELTNPSFHIEGPGYDNVTVFLLPGNYQLTLRTVTIPFAKENSTNITLFDSKYYRKITWTVGLMGDSFAESVLTSPLLTVLVVDQNSMPVASAEVQLYDSLDNLLAPKVTKSDGLAQFSVQPGFNYTIKV